MILKIIALMGALVGAPLSATAGGYFDMTCEALWQAQEDFVSVQVQNGAVDIVEATYSGPIEEVFKEGFSDLDDHYIARLQPRFGQTFTNFCLLNQTTKVSQAFDETANILQLDVSAENWGIVEINAEEALNTRCSQISTIGSGLVDGKHQFYNDPFVPMLNLFWTDFDLSDAESQQKAAVVQAFLMFECHENPDNTINDTLDILAEREGLQRKY